MALRMPEEIEIVPVTPGDLEAVHRLEVKAFPSPWRREFFESELWGNSRLSLAAKRGKHILAYVFAMWFFDEIHANKIAAEESERRKGLALALMDRCLASARHNRVRTTPLEVVPA